MTIRELSIAMVDTGVDYRFLVSYGNPPALQVSRRAEDNPILAWFRSEQEAGKARADLPTRWMMSCFQALALVAMQEYAEGRHSRERTADLLAEALLALLRA
jgi:hypothetical protein